VVPRAAGEHREPAEDQAEVDHLEEREVDDAGEEQPHRHHQHDARDGRGAPERAHHVASQHEHRHDDDEERYDDAESRAFVQELIDVDRHHPDAGEKRSGREHRAEEDARRAPPTKGGEHQQFAPQEHDREHHPGAGDDERRVEGNPREVVERAQRAEVVHPPRAVGGGERGRHDTADQHDAGEGDEVCRRGGGERAREALRGVLCHPRDGVAHPVGHEGDSVGERGVRQTKGGGSRNSGHLLALVGRSSRSGFPPKASTSNRSGISASGVRFPQRDG
jgi:hypothetical protein